METEEARAGATREGPSAGKPGREREQRGERDMTGRRHKAAEDMGRGSQADLTQGRDLEPGVSAPAN